MPSSERVGTEEAPSKSEPLPTPAGPIRAACAILLPIALIFLGSWADSLATPGSFMNRSLHFIGSADVALLIAVLAALVSLGPRIQTGRHHGTELLRRLTSESFEPIANVLMILAAAGGLSGILRDSGAAQATISLALQAHMPPLLLAWLLAAVVRVSMGSATVAMAVASGVLAPMVSHSRRAPRVAGASHRDGLARLLASQRSRVLDDSILLQFGNEGDLRHLDCARDGPLRRWPRRLRWCLPRSWD
jgi:H+/gluconate symporter-like permease